MKNILEPGLPSRYYYYCTLRGCEMLLDGLRLKGDPVYSHFLASSIIYAVVLNVKKRVVTTGFCAPRSRGTRVTRGHELCTYCLVAMA